MKSQLNKNYSEIISTENLFAAWQEFVLGKRTKKDVQEFQLNLSDNILQLHEDLANFSYKHSKYFAFNISDPKPRNIHKAAVRDRVLHHAVYRQLYPFFDKTFITDSYSCRLNKGTHKAIQAFNNYGQKVSENHTKTAWVLKCDIKRFFASIDHTTLLEILRGYISDESIIWLLKEIIESFHFGDNSKGLPLGNLTSQLFCNVYMNEFDQFIKHKLRAKYYIRYADDFVFLSDTKQKLINQISIISRFLSERLYLDLHPNKVFIKSLAAGVDFLGWIHFPYHRIVRAATKKRMMRRIIEHPENDTLQSYLGLLSHGNSYKVSTEVQNQYWLNHNSDKH